MLHGLLVRAWTLIIIAFAGALPAEVITVSLDGPTTMIQAAINSANVGDEIIVSTGTYHENLYIDKDIILRSTNPQNWDTVTSTIIDGGFAAPVILFSGDETSTCVVSGFTITHGLSNKTFFPYAGGIEGQHSSPTLEYNFITENASFGFVISAQGDPVWGGGRGGGIGNCHGLIQHNKIHDNYTDEAGGGIRNCDGTIQFNEITSNTTNTEHPLFNAGGGVQSCNGLVTSNTVSYNKTRFGGGFSGCAAKIVGNYISHNSAAEDGGGFFGCIYISHNIVCHNNAGINGEAARSCIGEIKNNFFYKNKCDSIGGALAICRGLDSK